MTAYRDRVRADAKEGRKGTFFLTKLISKRQMVRKSNLRNLLQQVEMAQIIDGVGSSGWSSAIGQENHLILPLADPLPANTSFSIELLFERHSWQVRHFCILQPPAQISPGIQDRSRS